MTKQTTPCRCPLRPFPHRFDMKCELRRQDHEFIDSCIIGGLGYSTRGFGPSAEAARDVDREEAAAMNAQPARLE